jgi:hypothetical protein
MARKPAIGAQEAAAETARHGTIAKAWKGGEHGRAAEEVIKGGQAAYDALVAAVPDDAALIAETVAAVRSRANG